MKKHSLLAVAFCSAFLLSACTHKPTNRRDPYEKFNRTMFAFNDGMDKAIMRPAARVYALSLPSPIRRGVYNVFENARYISTLPNDLLQGKLRFFLHDLARIVINTTLGIGGLIDVATKMGIKKHYQSLGMTLAFYSPKGSQSPYLVLPFFGSYTFRSATSNIADYFLDPLSYLKPKKLRYTLDGFRFLSYRDRYMQLNQLMDDAFDPYVLVRNAYLQRQDKRIATALAEKTPQDLTNPSDLVAHEHEHHNSA